MYSHLEILIKSLFRKNNIYFLLILIKSLFRKNNIYFLLIYDKKKNENKLKKIDKKVRNIGI